MFEPGDRILLVGEERTFYVRAGTGSFSTDKGTIDLDAVLESSAGDRIVTHSGHVFTILTPRPVDHFAYARRSGAPMLPKDIGTVIAYTGMNRNDHVLDAGSGSGICAIFFGNIAQKVTTYEVKPDFAKLARANIKDAGLGNVDVVSGDVLTAEGLYDVVHLDLSLTREHILHAHTLLRPGGFLACYTPFLEQLFTVLDTGEGLFSEIHAHECIEREMTRSPRGSRPSTRICHSGYVTIARK
ncbi:MAG: methyltransferase domain-containing protein [Methanolinea sp.]|nr:methyltransferase domain-containing protein [Methanolinea sp.]